MSLSGWKGRAKATTAASSPTSRAPATTEKGRRPYRRVPARSRGWNKAGNMSIKSLPVKTLPCLAAFRRLEAGALPGTGAAPVRAERSVADMSHVYWPLPRLLLPSLPKVGALGLHAQFRCGRLP